MNKNITLVGLDKTGASVYTYSDVHSIRNARKMTKEILRTMPLVESVVAVDVTANVTQDYGYARISYRPHVLFLKHKK